MGRWISVWVIVLGVYSGVNSRRDTLNTYIVLGEETMDQQVTSQSYDLSCIGVQMSRNLKDITSNLQKSRLTDFRIESPCGGEKMVERTR